MVLMQADVVSTMEQLAYAYQRDSHIVEAHQKVAHAIAAFQAAAMEQCRQKPQEPCRFSEMYQKSHVLEEFVSTTQTGSEHVRTVDRYALSQTMGLHNPEAIESISIGQEFLPIEAATPLNQRAIADWAVARSFEADQMNFMQQIAHMKKIELYFYWMDPSADQKSSLGFNLIGQIKVAQSQIDELKVKQEQIKTIVFQNSYRVVLDYNEALAAYRKTYEKAQEEQKTPRYEALFDQVLRGGELNYEEAKSAIQQYLATVIEQESVLSAFRVARAKIDRLMLAGYYERLLPKMPTLTNPIMDEASKA